MPYRYLEDIATADVAFEAWGETLEEMFQSAAEATMNVMVEDLETVAKLDSRTILAEADEIDMLLFELLQELIFHKDADRLLLRVLSVEINHKDGGFTLRAEASGEEINPDKHELTADVKAVTLHRFEVVATPEGWKSTVILDV